MLTTRTRGIRDPPQTSTQVVGEKRLRKLVTITAGAGVLTIGDLRTCLPLTSPELRILKLSVWGPDSTAASASAAISMVFPITAAATSTVGDNAVWEDEGTSGQSRAQIHVVPNFAFRSYWFTASSDPAQVVATFGTTATTTVFIVDITVQYRTSVQSCPALQHAMLLGLVDGPMILDT